MSPSKRDNHTPGTSVKLMLNLSLFSNIELFNSGLIIVNQNNFTINYMYYCIH